MRYRIFTLGCKVNSCDSDTISAVLEAGGLRRAEEDESPDLAVINTCAVTSESTRKSRQLTRHVKNLYPGCFVAVCGCFARVGEGASIPEEADAVIADTAAELTGKKILEAFTGKSSDELFPALLGTVHETRTRAALKIQDGCNRYCTYCIIPYLRGKLWSADPKDVTEKINALSSEGYREVVLTGIHIASYSFDGHGLIDLLEKVDSECSVDRFRLGSLEPVLMNEEFVSRLSRLGRLCPHFHLSLQSGSAGVLSRMKRRYSPEDYLGYMKTIRSSIPDAVFTTDIITGFPGESEEEFSETAEFVKKAGFAHVHIFPYSPRPLTPAAGMSGQLSRAEKHERLKELERVCAEVSRDVLSSFVGSQLEVLSEYVNERGLCEGYSENYLRVNFPGEDRDINRIVKVRVTALEDGMLLGEKVSDDRH